jgi:S-DNA-T family DNA segregation ATPase FtsK/SpoIIIE
MTSDAPSIEDRVTAIAVAMRSIGLQARLVEARRGPICDVLIYKPEGRTRVRALENSAPDLSVALGTSGVTCTLTPQGVAVIVPRPDASAPSLYRLAEAVASEPYKSLWLPLALGVDAYGEAVVLDLASLPHLLIAGSTGSGKSTLLTQLIAMLAIAKTHGDVQITICDPKGVEFRAVASLPHVVRRYADVDHIVQFIELMLDEVQLRYNMMSEAGARNYVEWYNAEPISALPMHVIIFDELADVLTASKPASLNLAKLVSRSRAAGVHIIAATQRPSVDVVKGLIKTNFPARIALRLTSRFDSRTVIDRDGAELLLARGDMLLSDPAADRLRRVHAAEYDPGALAALVDYAILADAHNCFRIKHLAGT